MKQRKDSTYKISDLVFFFFVAGWVLLGWTYTYDTDTPLGSDAPSTLDDHDRLTKDAIWEIQNVDHFWEKTGSEVSDADAGKHRQVTFQSPLAADPTSVDEDEGIIYTKDVSDKAEFFWKDEDENVLQITSGGYILGSSLLDGSLLTADIADANVTVAKMADDSIDSDQYVDGSIDAAHIADANITTAKIADAAVTVDKLSGELFGTWTNLDSLSRTLVKDEVYKAGSDGFVLGSGDRVIGKTDSSNPPTTQRVGFGDGYDKSFTMPVKKDDFWKTENAVGSTTIYWLPLGSGECVRQ